MIEKFECHREGAYVWSLLNLRFEVPTDFILTDSKRTVGRAGFIMDSKKLSAFADKTKTIFIEYFSMANILFKDTYKNLDKWLEEKYLKELCKTLRQRKIEFKEKEPRKIRRHKVIINQADRKFGFTWRGTTMYTNGTWYCSGSNRIYSVTFTSNIKRPIIFKREITEEEHIKLIDTVLSSFKCH